MRKRSLPQPEERTERRDLRRHQPVHLRTDGDCPDRADAGADPVAGGKDQLRLFHSGAGWRRGGDLGVSAPRQPLL